MSWVDDTKAPTKSAASVSIRKWLDGTAKAMVAKHIASSNCDVSVHLRRVLTISTMGLHSGFIVQGMSNRLVYMVILSLPMPMSLYIMSDIDVIAW